MIDVDLAMQTILAEMLPRQREVVALENALGRLLASDVPADRPMPPFDRVTMDGIAIRKADLESGVTHFERVGFQPAGHPPLELTDAEKCVEVATGAVLPKGTDWVVRYEDLERLPNGFRLTLVPEINHVHPQGCDVVQGQIVLSAGTIVGSAEWAVLASLGIFQVEVVQFPPVTVVSGGDELIAVHETPQPWQIRRSNPYALAGGLAGWGISPQLLDVPDDPQIIRERLAPVLQKPGIVILSGGVSRGATDYIPRVLAELGVENRFHGVAQRPGKPLWFGRNEHTLVFALPGNPVSTFFCFAHYIAAWLGAYAGIHPVTHQVVLAEDIQSQKNLTWFVPARLQVEAGKLCAYPRPGSGSGDYAGLVVTHGFLRVPPGGQKVPAGTQLPWVSSQRVW